MACALIRLCKGVNGAPVPVVAPLMAKDNPIEASFRRIIQQAPVEQLFDAHGNLNSSVSLSTLVPSWTRAEASQARMLLNWAHPSQMRRSPKGVIELKSGSPSPKVTHKGRLPVHVPTATGPVVHGSAYNFGPLSSQSIQLSDQACQALMPASINDATTADFARNDASLQLQIAIDKLNAAKTDYQNLDLRNPDVRQLNSDLNDMGSALLRWQQDRDQASAAVSDATTTASLCTNSGAADQDGHTLSDWAAEAQAFGVYFTDPNRLLQVAVLNQQYQALWQSMVDAVKNAQQANIQLQQNVQGLSAQINGCTVVQNQWWGVQLVFGEDCTQALLNLLQLATDKSLSNFLEAAAAALISAAASPLTMLFWFIAFLESLIVQGDIKGADKGNGVTVNISWIPISATILLDIASSGTATPEMLNLVKLAEEGTLFAELSDPGFGNQWFSFFWITGN
jgi:hypothetical protein